MTKYGIWQGRMLLVVSALLVVLFWTHILCAGEAELFQLGNDLLQEEKYDQALAAYEVIAGTDPVAVDAYTTTLFSRDPSDIGHIQYAYQQGVGEVNLQKLNIREIPV